MSRHTASTEESQKIAPASGLSPHHSIRSGTACTQQIQPYAHTHTHHIAPYSCRSEECTERIYSTHNPSAHNLRGWEGTWKGHRVHYVPPGQDQLSDGPADSCLCNLPSKTSCKGRPTSSSQLSSPRLSGVAQRIFPRCPNCTALSQDMESCFQGGQLLQLSSKTEEVETVC